MSETKNVYSILQEKNFNETAGEHHRVLGGIAAHAILGSKRIDYTSQSIFIPRDIHLNNYRENGTLRDIDILHIGSQQDLVAAKKRIEQTLDGRLVSSVFPLIPEGNRWSLQRLFLTERVLDNQRNYSLRLGRIVTRIPKSTYNGWSVHYEDNNDALFQTISPVSILGGYTVRSITGIRPKDQEKVEELKSKIFGNDEEAFARWLAATHDESISRQITEQITSHKTHQDKVSAARNNKPTYKLRSKLLSRAERETSMQKLAQGKFDSLLRRFVGKN